MSGDTTERSSLRGATSTPTLHEVAAEAGVSPMTASRVLSGAPGVRPERTKRVLEAAESLGYRRNENARSLRPGQRTGLVGVIITNAANPYYAELQLGIEQVLDQRGIRVLVGNTGEDVGRERRLVADFIGWNVDGLIVVPSGGEISHLAALAKLRKPLVFAARSLADQIDADAVLIDDLGGTRLAISNLLAEGYRRIAFLGLGMSVAASKRRLQGFREAHDEGGIPVDEDLIFVGREPLEPVDHAARDLLNLASPPTAVFCANNRNTVALMHALSSVPRVSGSRGIRVTAFDNFDTADLMPVHLSIVDHDARELGRQAANLLVSRLDGDQAPPRHLELPTAYIA